jgi:hypothetical protein
MRWHVVLQDEGWAVWCSLANKTHKLNQEIVGTQVYICRLHAYTSVLVSSHNIHTDRIPISTSRDLHKTTPLVPNTPASLHNCVLSLTFRPGFVPLHSTVSLYYCFGCRLIFISQRCHQRAAANQRGRIGQRCRHRL